MMTPRSWTCVFLLMFGAFGQRANPAGEWQTVVGKQHLNLKVEQAEGGALTGTVVAVDQGNTVVRIDAFSFGDDGSVRFEMKSIPASFEGRLAADGATIAGEWKQGGASIPLVFRRPGASAAAFTLKPATKGKIALEPCRAASDAIEALCGRYEVFENRQTRAGRKIALNIMIIPAKADAPDPDPLFALAGGPGQSATEAYPLAAYVRAGSETDVASSISAAPACRTCSTAVVARRRSSASPIRSRPACRADSDRGRHDAARPRSPRTSPRCARPSARP